VDGAKATLWLAEELQQCLDPGKPRTHTESGQGVQVVLPGRRLHGVTPNGPRLGVP
jgi:hypothetical protein